MAVVTEMERISMLLADPEKATMRIEEIIAEEIREFKASEEYKRMVEAEQYYRNRSDVQNKKNDVANRTNTKIEHPILRKLINQKENYLLSKPFTVKAEHAGYGKALNEMFDQAFRQKVKSLTRGAIKNGIAWLQPYFRDGKPYYMRLPSTEVIPLWEDAEKTELGGFIRFYEQTVYTGNRKGKRMLAELWTREGVRRYEGGQTTGDGPASYNFTVMTEYGTEASGDMEPHFTVKKAAYTFAEVPVVWLRYNEDELPLCHFVKDLIDDINWQTSVTADVLRDIAKFIYVLRGYGGQDLAEFVKDLQENLAIKTEGDGGVDKLQADLNIDAVMAFLEKNHQDVIYYADGVDTKDPELGNASGNAINFRYMDLDNDCQALAAGLQETFARLKLFVDVYLQAAGKGNFTGETFEIVFNMDMPVNETDVISNVRNSTDLSMKTRLENHPWVTDVEKEMEQLAKEKEEAMRLYGEGLFDDALGANDPHAAPGQEEKPPGDKEGET